MFYLFSFIFFIGFIVSVFFMFMMLDYNSVLLEVFLPISYFLDFPLCFCFDYISLCFFSCVSLISSVVFLYSKFYMNSLVEDSSDNNRFYYLLFLFVISMFFLIFSYSWVLVMVGWDGLGVVSFLLVIYYNNSSSLDSGLVTIFTNRLGDCFFILSFMFLYYCGWSSFDYLLSFDYMMFCIIVLLGCITKSAQMPFSSWLPAAMAAPTPVSSLVHSSTLVTAGVYLLIRFNFFFESFFFLVMVISLFTMFISGGFAIYEYDFKKVVAMSTLSQLGFMIFAISLGYWWLGFLHMVFHAFFKSILFLSTGSLMHFLLGDQDSRFFGGFYNSFFSKLLFSLSCLSLMGFPFSLGFYSKDVIIGEFFFNYNSVFFFLFFLSCCFTVCYSIRLLSMGFLNFPSFNSSFNFSEDFMFFMPLMLLFFLCTLSGNYFFMNFLSFSTFSFYDYFFGVFIIIVGVMFFFYKSTMYMMLCSLSNMVFLTPLTLMSSFMLSKFEYSMDQSWGEKSTSKGMNSTLFFFYSYAMWLYKWKFLHFAMILLFIFVVV